jgi:REP-associated tyrosine transposase
MSRPLRIEYPNAWYHVMNRGRRSETIFTDKEDYLSFIQLMQDACSMFNFRISAYCLMSNHYHILLQTPEANLSRCMRHINGIYTQRFNRRYHVDGQLFRGRFKSILVEEDSYLLELVKYIHSNPLQAGIVDKLDKYPWSSHKEYIARSQKGSWLYKDFISSMLTKNRKDCRKAYLNLINGPEERGILEIFTKKSLPAILGTKDFVEKIKKKFYDKSCVSQVPQSAVLAPSVVQIKQIVERTYQVSSETLRMSRRGFLNEPRNVAIYLSRKYSGKKLLEIGSEFNISRYSSVSSVVEKMKIKVLKDKKIKERVLLIEKKLIKGQTET